VPAAQVHVPSRAPAPPGAAAGAGTPPGGPSASLALDWLVAGLSAVFIAGLFVDGWAHTHGRVDQTFFTPWHALFYAGFAALATALGLAAARGRRRGRPWARALPPGYGLSLAGVLVFAAGGVADMVWHELFGVEESVEALLSPTHLVLALGAVLVVTGPLRAAGRRPPGRWASRLPAALSLAAAFSVLTFFTLYAHVLVYPAPAVGYPYRSSESSGVAAILLQAALLAGVALFAARTGVLVPGGLALVVGLNAAAMTTLHESWTYRWLPVLAVGAAGLAADGLGWALAPGLARPGPLRAFAFAVPALYYAGYFLGVALGDGLAWSVHLWTGSIVLAGTTGWLASYLVAPPAGFAPPPSPPAGGPAPG
jgi:hypothetical protein